MKISTLLLATVFGLMAATTYALKTEGELKESVLNPIDHETENAVNRRVKEAMCMANDTECANQKVKDHGATAIV